MKYPKLVLLATLLLVVSVGVETANYLEFLNAGSALITGHLPLAFLLPLVLVTGLPLAIVFGLLRGIGWVRYLVVLIGALVIWDLTDWNNTGTLFFRAWPWLNGALQLAAIALLFMPSSRAWFRTGRAMRASASQGTP